MALCSAGGGVWLFTVLFAQSKAYVFLLILCAEELCSWVIPVHLLLGGVCILFGLFFFPWVGKGDCPEEQWMLIVVPQIRRRSGSIAEVVYRMKYGI